ncbi:hypothetical protein GCM10010341_03020 [Streptomyces noursei]|nr:hypothetical protein GCM10010341_03020 [Streptomyces noursei]
MAVCKLGQNEKQKAELVTLMRTTDRTDRTGRRHGHAPWRRTRGAVAYDTKHAE